LHVISTEKTYSSSDKIRYSLIGEKEMTPNEAKHELSKYRDKPFREHQEEAIRYILDSEKRFVFLEAPTGSGKSLIAMVAGYAMSGVTYSVHSKILQHQITEDFPEAKSLFGRANYDCVAASGIMCDECYHSKYTPCKTKGECIYDREKRVTLGSRLRILNYDYLLTECNYSGRFSGSAFNIIDEADNMENTLINFVTLTFTSYSLGKLGIAPFAQRLRQTSKDQAGLLEEWQNFASTAKIRAQGIIDQLTHRIGNSVDLFGDVPEQTQKDLKERTRVQRLLMKIQLFQDNVDETWVLDADQEDKFIFRPLWMNEALAEAFLWRHAKKWVLMSASFLPVHLEARRLGIPMDEVDYKCLPSTFPIERRPIYVESAANLTGKTMEAEVPKLCVRIKEIVSSHPNVKGLIHGVSYKLSKEIMSRVGDKRLIIHDSSNRIDVLTDFMESKEPLVLVSPSMERGVSLEADLCRFIIVAKAPWLYLGDKIVSKRVWSGKMGQNWYLATMLTTVLQATGRGMRSEEDYCESYILDEQFKLALAKSPTYVPEWWRSAIAW
jgi:Rad3-related DNA helicase